MRVASCFGEMTQQIHSFRARGVSLSQAACVVASDASASDKSPGILCKLPDLLLLSTAEIIAAYEASAPGQLGRRID
jgi:hypothetical protein